MNTEQKAMKEYILFLDESKPNMTHPYFCLGGCIIERNHYAQAIVPFVESMKKDIWGNNSVVLHETDIREAKKGTPYQKMRVPEVRDRFWKHMRDLFDSHEITVISVVYDPAAYKNIYASKYLKDEYFSSLQIILENYAYFLEQKNARGSICIESRNPTEDNKLKAHYFNLMANGTLFLNALCLQNHINGINFSIKSDNNIGLQISDFIPNVIKKHAHAKSQRRPSIISNILPHLYEGGIGDIARFGIKKF